MASGIFVRFRLLMICRIWERFCLVSVGRGRRNSLGGE